MQLKLLKRLEPPPGENSRSGGSSPASSQGGGGGEKNGGGGGGDGAGAQMAILYGDSCEMVAKKVRSVESEARTSRERETERDTQRKRQVRYYWQQVYIKQIKQSMIAGIDRNKSDELWYTIPNHTTKLQQTKHRAKR